MYLLKPDDNASVILVILTLIGVAVLAVRLLIWTDTFHSGLLYIAWPFVLSLALYYFTPTTEGTSWKRRFWNNLRVSMIVMLACSLILMEGYVCVVMFMPIFLSRRPARLHRRLSLSPIRQALGRRSPGTTDRRRAGSGGRERCDDVRAGTMKCPIRRSFRRMSMATEGRGSLTCQNRAESGTGSSRFFPCPRRLAPSAWRKERCAHMTLSTTVGLHDQHACGLDPRDVR